MTKSNESKNKKNAGNIKMIINKINPKVLLVFVATLVIIALTLFIFLYREKNSIRGLLFASFETQPTLTMSPELNISRFSPYVVSATNVEGNPDSVSLEIRGKNGNNANETCWDYYADGTCGSETVIKTMTKNGDIWQTGNIYPDSIYPEIYFANSSTTWNNTPLSRIIRRNDYQIMHFDNPFIMVGDMYYYIEINASPASSVNSADLEVYLVEKDKNINFFNSTWLNSDSVELVGTFNKDATYHHTHSQNSSHKLIPITTNPDGTVGTKNLDINGDFWLILYSNSPNNNRGWSMQYQPNLLCNKPGRWFSGNVNGWTTTELSGCPDSHIHIARRDSNYLDGIEVILRANYGDEVAISSPTNFYFQQIPNLPPNSTSFINPQIGATYAGNIDVSWDPASDPNNDPVTYNIFLIQNDNVVSELARSFSETSLSLNSTLVPDGDYSLRGEVCDNINPCTSFSLGGVFSISNTAPIQSISSITLSSNNNSANYAKLGDTITLTFSASGIINEPVINFYLNGDEIGGNLNITNLNNNWTVTYTIQQNDSEGSVTFDINSSSLDKLYNETTNASSVLVDLTPPTKPTGSLESGTYLSTQTNLASFSSLGHEKILYTMNNSNPTCDNGLIYADPLLITNTTIIKVIACDLVGNISETATFEYVIKEDLTTISLSSSNTNPIYAKHGDILNLEFVSTDTISEPIINLSINNTPVTGNIILTNTNQNQWRANYTILETDSDGSVSFSIESANLHKIFTETTDNSSVTVDKNPPTQPLSSPISGSYSNSQSVSLLTSSFSYINYSIDGTIPSCSAGLRYTTPIIITTNTTIKAISCDEAGNKSELISYTYTINNTISNEENLEEEQESTSSGNISETNENESKNSQSVNDNDLDAQTEQESEVNNDLDSQEENDLEDIDIEFNNKTEPDDSFNSDEEDNQLEINYRKPVDNIYKTSLIRDGEKIYIAQLIVRILDNKGDAISNILVNLYSDPKQSYTDFDGFALFNNIELGKHTVSVNYNGRNYEKEINIEEPEIIEEEIELEVIKIILDESENQENNTDSITTIIIKFIIALSLGLLIFLIVIFEKRKQDSKKQN